MPTVLVLKVMDGSRELGSQEITFDDGSLVRIPEAGDIILIGDSTNAFRGRVSGRDFDYTQLPGNEDGAVFITLWADMV